MLATQTAIGYSLFMKAPHTKPNWTKGNYSLWVRNELQGYFRRFDSARRWRIYLENTLQNETVVYIQHNGQTINIKRIGEEVTL